MLPDASSIPADAYWSSPEGIARKELRQRYLARARAEAERREELRQGEWEGGEGRVQIEAWRARVKAVRLEERIPERVWRHVERAFTVVCVASIVGVFVAAVFQFGIVWGVLATVAVALGAWVPVSLLTIVCLQIAAAAAVKRAGLSGSATTRVLFGIAAPAVPARPSAPARARTLRVLPALEIPVEALAALSSAPPPSLENIPPDVAAWSGAPAYDRQPNDEAWRDAHPVPTFSFSAGYRT
jgi:hypothetical protein